MKNNKTETKITTILERIESKSKDGSKFLVLITNPSKIYAFSSEIPWKELEKLQVGKSYEIETIINNKGNKKLVSFSRAIIIEC